MANILILDSEANIRKVISLILIRAGHAVRDTDFDVFPKPFSPASLSEKVSQMLDPKARGGRTSERISSSV
jgi:hypothetical protein